MSDRSRLPRARREHVFARSEGRCQHCGEPISFEAFHVSHLISVAHGGSDHESNLEAWCLRCNLTQGATDAADPRITPRAWQLRALAEIVRTIELTGTATISAAPAAGKTIFTGLVFRALYAADRVDRLVVVVPRKALVGQWVEALNAALQIQLKPDSAIERRGQDGVVVTYQSLLSEDQRDAHITQCSHSRTLVTLDEAHHGAEKIDGRTAWSRSVGALVGEIGDLNVAAVLNLSGTLWRSNPSERIPTVRYQEEHDGRITTLVDFRVDADELIREGQLRPLDLYRLGTQVRMADYRDLELVEGGLADLDESQARAALRELPSVSEWLQAFVASVLDRLATAHRDLGNYHAKALIVAARQDHARAFYQEVNRQMTARGLRGIAELAISNDGDDARRALESFRSQRRVGVLCTVDMAGEGYDCPDIAVVGYATNKLTTLYVRQVVARAMRVTDRERELGLVLPAAIVLPDSPLIVDELIGYLGPYVQELVQRDSVEPEHDGDGPRGPGLSRYGLEQARLTDDEIVTIAMPDGSTEHIDADIARRFAQNLERFNIPGSFAPRAAIAHRLTVGELLDARPFDPPSGQMVTLESVQRIPASIEQTARMLMAQLQKLGGWIAINGTTPIDHFNRLVNQAAGIPDGGRPTASVEQLQAALTHAKQLVREEAERLGRSVPRSAE